MNCTCSIPIVLTDLRANKHRGQAELGTKIHRSAKTISAWESGFRIVKVKDLANLCGEYGITMSQFFADVEKYERAVHNR